MSVGGWLTENHQRPVAARETAQQSSAEALQQEARPAARPVAAATESGRGALDPAWGICQHNSALQRPLICDTPIPLIVGTELLRPGRESTSRACTRRLGGEADSHVLSTEMARTPPP